MLKKPGHQQHGISRGRIVGWPVAAPRPEDVAALATFNGDNEHKTYDSPAGPPALKCDKAKCDQYEVSQWSNLQSVLRDAIMSGCVGPFRGDFPYRAWAYINGVLHEARLTNQEQGT